ncbi:MAG: Lpg1974 family pore-forming outer membrane protein [Chlamydiota bacterium]|jgi:hypothetical protein
MNKKGLLILLSVVALSYGSEQCCANTCESIKGNTGYLHTARGCYRNDICCNSDRWGGIFTADLLIWQAKVDGLEFAAKNSIFQTQGLNINASNVYPDFDWRPGVKVGLGVYIPCDWDFYSNFTYFYTNSKTSTSAETSIFGFGLIPLIRHPANVPTTPLRFGSASSQWKMDFYTLDCELGYAMIVSKYLDLRLHGGLKGAIINQEYTVQYRNGQTIGDIQVNYGNVDLKNDSRGIGPRLGLQSKWRLKKEWFIQSSGAVSAILSQFDIRRNETDQALNTDTNTEIITDINFTEKIWRWNPALDMILGIGWERCFGCFQIQCNVNYEIQYFWEQNLMRRFTDNFNEALNVSTKGDLMLHGVSFQFRFDF